MDFKYLTPPSIFSEGSRGFLTPKPSAVFGINCIKPNAPTRDFAFGLKPDSCLITALTNSGSIPYLSHLSLTICIISSFVTLEFLFVKVPNADMTGGLSTSKTFKPSSSFVVFKTSANGLTEL